MSGEFKEQVAIVTGAASGLGLAIAKKLCADDAQVAMFDLNEEVLRSAAGAIGPGAVPFAVDLTNESQVNNVVAQVAERFGRIDVLVNSAGVTGATNIKSHEVETDNLRFVFEVNFMASFFMARAVLPSMLKQQHRR